MGRVFCAYDPDLDRKLAIKLMHENVAAKVPLQLLHEARSMAKLSHPNLVQVFDVGTHDDQLYIAMEMVDGADVQTWTKNERPRPERVIELMIAAGRGLAAAHRLGIIHRDLKGSNILLAKDDSVKIADFGLSRLLDEVPQSVPVGTPLYMAPEVHSGTIGTERSDQYSFAVESKPGLAHQEVHPSRSTSPPGWGSKPAEVP